MSCGPKRKPEQATPTLSYGRNNSALTFANSASEDPQAWMIFALSTFTCALTTNVRQDGTLETDCVIGILCPEFNDTGKNPCLPKCHIVNFETTYAAGLLRVFLRS